MDRRRGWLSVLQMVSATQPLTQQEMAEADAEMQNGLATARMCGTVDAIFDDSKRAIQVNHVGEPKDVNLAGEKRSAGEAELGGPTAGKSGLARAVTVKGKKKPTAVEIPKKYRRMQGLNVGLIPDIVSELNKKSMAIPPLQLLNLVHETQSPRDDELRSTTTESGEARSQRQRQAEAI